ncbi:hypothetical protein F4776DRAFT_617438 [Hypoxylon sp. NC0597]|nr:hypothetical protein F4776DRAFT_617438 [Hypoxylon sp. NC0597]
MPSSNGLDPMFGDSSPFDQPVSNHPPWPYVVRFQQAQIEKNFFEEGATIHFERLPTLQFWAPFFLVTDSSRVAFVTAKVVGSSKLSRRRLTAEEIDATSEAAAISCRYFPWIQPVSLAVASAITLGTRQTFSFPFYRPEAGKFDPLVFPTKRVPMLRGIRAVYAWHAFRFLCYYPPVLFGSLLFFSSLAETSYEARLLRDPRLKGMMADMRRNSRQLRQQQNSPQGSGAGAPHPAKETPSVPRFPRDQYPSQPESQAAQDYGRDTYTGQSEGSSTEPATSPSRSTTITPPQSSWSRNSQSQAPPSKPQDVRYPESDWRSPDYDSDLFDDDDASPVSAASRRAEAQQARDTQSGSAWDRIRRQSQSGNTQWTQGDSSGQERGWGQLRQDKTQNPREAQPKTESFAYTKQEEEKETRNYEKEQAQKEFDALLEAERRGGSSRG